ncbi:MAG TPA: hypothetical protein DCE08_01450 [Ruminococcaceae bacterium]|nr:hypothetical protein [Oscillospiraceae bacterium]
MKKHILTVFLAALLLCSCAAPEKENTSDTASAPVTSEVVRTVPQDITPVGAQLRRYMTEEHAKPIVTEFYFSDGKATGYGMYLQPTAYLPESRAVKIAYPETVREYGWGEDAVGKPVLVSVDPAETVKLLLDEPVLAVAAGSDAAYAIGMDKSTLWRLPYGDEAPQTLFTDRFARMDGALEFFEDCVYFTAGADDTHNGIYRLYLPDGSLTLLVSDLPSEPMADGKAPYRFTVVSNHELAWEVYSDLPRLGKEQWEQAVLTDKNGAAVSPKELYGGSYDELAEPEEYLSALEREMHRKDGSFSAKRFYYHTESDVTLTCFGFMYDMTHLSVFYPDASTRPESQHCHESLWWLDEYYYREGTIKSR